MRSKKDTIYNTMVGLRGGLCKTKKEITVKDKVYLQVRKIVDTVTAEKAKMENPKE